MATFALPSSPFPLPPPTPVEVGEADVDVVLGPDTVVVRVTSVLTVLEGGTDEGWGGVLELEGSEVGVDVGVGVEVEGGVEIDELELLVEEVGAGVDEVEVELGEDVGVLGDVVVVLGLVGEFGGL